MLTVGLILIVIGVLLAVFTTQKTAGLVLAIVGLVLLLVAVISGGALAV